MKRQEICKYFLKGTCSKGDNCNFIHDYNLLQNNHQNKNCKFFLSDTCTKQDCKYFHGYCEKLEHVKKIENHQKPINNLINMDDTKFISSDEASFYVRFSGNNEYHTEKIAEDYKIGKLVYFSDNVICAIQKEGM